MKKHYFIFADEYMINHIKLKGVDDILKKYPYTRFSLGVHVPGDSPVTMMYKAKSFDYYKEITGEEFENVKQQIEKDVAHGQE